MFSSDLSKLPAAYQLDQVSWGTKGSDKVDPLPSLDSKTKEAGAKVVEDTVKVQEDVDAAFKETVTRALTKVVVKEVVEKPNQDDENKTFRTRLVATWMLSNASLAVAIENLNGLPNAKDPNQDLQHLRDKQNTYFGFILYATFGLAAVRFIGVRRSLSRSSHLDANPSFSQCVFYFFKRNLFRFCRRN